MSDPRSINQMASDVKDAVKIVAQVSSGNAIGVAVAAVKNKRFRRILLWGGLAFVFSQMLGFILLVALVSGAADLLTRPLAIFGSGQTITTSAVIRGVEQSEVINFKTLADAWQSGLTAPEIAQVNQLQLGLSYGLLDAFYEIGAGRSPRTRAKQIQTVATQLQPRDAVFRAVTLRKVSVKTIQEKGKSVQKKVVSYVTEMVLQHITRYNGYWTVQWHIAAEPDGSQIVVFDGTALAQKDYSPLYDAEARYNFLRNTTDQQLLWTQALILDSNFYDPAALPLLSQLEGGSASETAPGTGLTIPEPQIIAILQQAIQIDHVPESWLSGLEAIVGHEDASGNPFAVDPIPVDGEHASGLMQMLPSTFWSDRVAGYDDIWNPLDNAVAAIRHIEGAWGSPYDIPGVVSGVYKGY